MITDKTPPYDFNFVDEAGACQIVGGEATPIHRTTLWRMIKENGFPQPLKPTPGSCRWKVSEIAAYLEKAAAARATNKIRPNVLAMNAATRGKRKNPGQQGRPPKSKLSAAASSMRGGKKGR